MNNKQNSENPQNQQLNIVGVSGSVLTKRERNSICCEFMAKFGGLNHNKVNDDVKADSIMQWVIKQIEHYR